MNGRERMVKAIEFAGPDRLPCIHSVWPRARQRLGAAVQQLMDEFPDDVAGYFNRTIWDPSNPFY